ncbi:MAG: serine/threonine-protein kinase [Planctomycetota bacterium]
MTTEREQQVQSLFCEVIQVDISRRHSFLEERCGDDASLKSAVLKLLEQDQQLGETAFLEASPAGIPQLVHEDLCGNQLGAFKLMKHLGSGGMGEVYLGTRDDEFKQQAAVKVIRTGIKSEASAGRFRKEMQFLAALGRHSGITNILDAGVTDSGQWFIAMEYVDGQPINQYCDSKRLGIRDRLRLFCTACDAVQFAHQNAVLHRDIKPSNLLVTDSGEPKLIDFGVAKLMLDQDAPETSKDQTQHQPMTPGYASPEQLEGQHATTASDVYALGVILYELLVGHLPHPLAGCSLAEMVRLVCDTDPATPSRTVTSVAKERGGDRLTNGSTGVTNPQQLAEFRGLTSSRLQSELRGDLDRIVMKAVDREVDQRYATVEQLTADIERYLSGHPVKAQQNSFGYRAKKYIRRNAWGVTAAAAFVLLLVGSVVVTSRLAFVANQSAKAEREQRVLASQAADAEREQRLRANQLAEAERQQRLLAEKREKTAHKTVDVFNQLLISSNPHFSTTTKVSAKELIESFARSLNAKTVEDPVIEARLLQSLSSACIGTGDYKTAHEKIQQAIELFKEQVGENHFFTASAMLRSAQNFLLDSKLDLARERFEEIITISEKALQEGTTELDSSWNILLCNSLTGKAEAEMRLSHLDEAGGLIERALPLLRFLDSDEQASQTGRLKTYQSVVRIEKLVKQNKIDEAIPIAEQQYKRTCEQFGENSIQVAADVDQLARLFTMRGRFDDAKRSLHKSLEVVRKHFGDVHPETLTREMRAAKYTYYAKRYAEAEPHFREYDSIHRKLNRHEGRHHIQLLLWWADCLRKLEKQNEAKQIYERCLDFSVQADGENHETTLELKKRLAEVATVSDDNPKEAE